MKLLTGLVLAAVAGGAAAQCEEAVLTTTAGNSNGLGAAVALDGDLAVLGAPFGAVEDAYIFRETPSGWVQEARLVNPTPTAINYGDTVAVSGGLVGINAGTCCVTGGMVHLYEQIGGTWKQTGTIQPQTLTSLWGRSFAIVGRTVLIGSQDSVTPSGPSDGIVEVYEEVGGVWTLVQTIEGTNSFPAGNEDFGNVLAVDGDRLAVMSRWGSAGFVPPGFWAVHVFDRSGGVWNLDQRIDSPASLDWSEVHIFSVDVSGDSLVVRAREALGDYWLLIYDRDPSGNWNLSAQFAQTDLGPAGTLVLPMVAIEGDRVLATSRSAFQIEPSVALIERDTFGGWALRAALFPTNPFASVFGGSLALDAGRALIGDLDSNLPGFKRGAGYVVNLEISPVVYCTGKLNSLGCIGPVDWSGVPSLTNPEPCKIVARSIHTNVPGLLFYGTNGSTALPFLGGTLCVNPPLNRTLPQTSGGTPIDACTGMFTFDLNAWIQAGIDPNLNMGAVVNAQFWSRDADHPDGTGVHLTEAIELPICP